MQRLVCDQYGDLDIPSWEDSAEPSERECDLEDELEDARIERDNARARAEHLHDMLDQAHTKLEQLTATDITDIMLDEWREKLSEAISKSYEMEGGTL